MQSYVIEDLTSLSMSNDFQLNINKIDSNQNYIDFRPSSSTSSLSSSTSSSSFIVNNNNNNFEHKSNKNQFQILLKFNFNKIYIITTVLPSFGLIGVFLIGILFDFNDLFNYEWNCGVSSLFLIIIDC